MGARTTLSHLVLSKPHLTAARQKGNNAADMMATLDRQLAECIVTANHLVDDMRRANPDDPNIQTLSTLITTLS
jgi:hypothetical protein